MRVIAVTFVVEITESVVVGVDDIETVVVADAMLNVIISLITKTCYNVINYLGNSVASTIENRT